MATSFGLFSPSSGQNIYKNLKNAGVYNVLFKLRTSRCAEYNIKMRFKKLSVRILTEETLDDNGVSLEVRPGKSLTRLPQQIGVSKKSAHPVIKWLRLKPYKLRVQQTLPPPLFL